VSAQLAAPWLIPFYAAKAGTPRPKSHPWGGYNFQLKNNSFPDSLQAKSVNRIHKFQLKSFQSGRVIGKKFVKSIS